LTEHQKRKSRLPSSRSETKSLIQQVEEKTEPIKPKIPTGKSHIKKNIDAAFTKTKEGLLSKLSEADKNRLEELMSAIEMTIDGNASEEEALRRAIPNPYDSTYGEGERLN